jgi:signal transduction histidine kinase
MLQELKTQLKRIATVFERQESFQQILREIDQHIIGGEPLNETLSFTAKKIILLTQAEQVCFVFGKAELRFNVDGEIPNHSTSSENFHSKLIKIDIGEKKSLIYIDKIKIEYNKNNSLSDLEVEYMDSEIINMLNGIGVQINIAISHSVSKNIHQLYESIISEFAKSGDSDRVYKTICNKIVDVFPRTRSKPIVSSKHVHVQLLFFNKSKEELRIVGSTNDFDIGGIVYKDCSISGSLFMPKTKDQLDSGYRCETYNNREYIYFVGDPRIEGTKYKKTINDTIMSELTIPLYLEDMTPIGVINLESRKENYFRETHARSLIDCGNNLAKLVYDVFQLSESRKDTADGMMLSLKRYIDNTNREFRHQISQPMLRLDSLSNKLEKNTNIDSAYCLNRLNSIQTSIRNAQQMLSNALSSFSKRSNSCNLKDAISEVQLLLGEVVHEEGIEISVNIQDGTNIVRLDSLFVQYLHDLLKNSIDSIILQKGIKNKKNEGYYPKIEITTKLVDEFGLNDNDCEDNNKRCMMKIYDNGIGISEENKAHLGEKGFTHGKKDGTGIGLYSFQHYLTFHNAKIARYKGEEGKCFSISFIMDISR